VTRERHPAARAFNLLALAAGGVGLAIAAHQLGWAGMRHAVVGTGAWFAVIAAIDLCGALCDAFAIHGLLRPHARVAYARVFAAQISGIAINRLTPGNSLGEPVKVTMLVREVPVDTAVPAIVLFNLCTIYLGIVTIALGAPVTALMLDLPEQVERVVWSGLAALVALALVLAWLVHRGAAGTLVAALARARLISFVRAKRWRARVAAIDARLQAVRDPRASGLARGVAGVVGSRVCNWLGTIVVMYAADIPLTAPLVLASLSVGILVTWITNIVPLGLGIADGTNYVLYGLLGASPVAGLLFTMVNRLRTVVLALIGLGVMAIANTLHRREVDSDTGQ
jgi:uncharacterized membrane protein YbhN (UPF0104 family)